MENNTEIRQLVSQLVSLINKRVPEKPTYWWGTPEGYDFPLSSDDFTHLWATLNRLLRNLEGEMDEDEDEYWEEEYEESLA
jgi:hypothetical protein